MVFSRDGKTLAASSGDATIMLLDLATGKEKPTPAGPAGEVWALADTRTARTGRGRSGRDDQAVGHSVWRYRVSESW